MPGPSLFPASVIRGSRFWIAVLPAFLTCPATKAALLNPETTSAQTASAPDIEKAIKELIEFSIAEAENSTDSASQPSTFAPRAARPPKPFDAGLFKITFVKGEERKSIICQTEEVVGHYGKVIPGETEIGGYIEWASDLPDKRKGRRLSPAEMKLLCTILYRMLEKPRSDREAARLNGAKDIILGILFSGRGTEQVAAFHLEQMARSSMN